MISAWSSRLGVCVVVPAALLAACTTTVTPVAMPEPVATTSAGAVEFYTAVQRDVLTALSAEFPGVRFEPKYASTTAGCTLPDGTSGLTVHLPIHGSGRPVPVNELDRAARVFEDTAARAGFHGRHVLPPDTGFAVRMFAADGSYITFGSYVAATVGLTVGCYRE
ncbi:LppA family lipoprotein [Rhodococcus rhodochrous]|uniref:Putative LppA-like lipoprotein n=1 Tax=Rhodococcus rhodochrous J45 TaxID=935266 RepID=A0A562DLK7_RHORH|nr:LppA family lipoprotein [Rhodococcus rhodochrous]TWH10558.1 putative LppA-like lipoprotein [Rhodococcus rhodochrous J45]